MALSPGTKLGPYEIVATAGAGGMGEVYEARDPRLGRTVAIKVLPSELTNDPAARQRLEREARAVAALSHPHVCALFDVGHQQGIDFLVMEFLEGETLATRLARGRLPFDQALQYGVQVAGALAAAHGAGIVHRDLKPGNIMVTKAGVKLLDFGLAKPREPAVVAGMSTVETLQPLTGPHTIVGTLQYMAPEQLQGRQADARTDVFAFGSVLYEMFTGTRPFDGSNQASLTTAIMSADPAPLTTALPITPVTLDRLVRKCLAKDPESRWQSTRDLAEELDWIAEAGAAAVPSGSAATPRSGSRDRLRLAGYIAAAIALAVATMRALIWAGMFQPVGTDARVVRFFIAPPDRWNLALSWPLTVGAQSPLAISPDGRRVAFVARAQDGRTLLWVRGLDSLTDQVLNGTEGASSPFWSPDSRSLGFFANGQLKKIDASGGPSVTLCDVLDNRGGAWGPDGTIIFASSASVTARLPTGLQKVSGSGGQPAAATELAAGETSHVEPVFLPDGRHFLYRALSVGQAGDGPVYVASLDSTERTRLLTSTSTNLVVAASHLLFLRDTTLMAQPFDPRRFTLSGDAVPVAQDIRTVGAPPVGVFSASENGVLTYMSSTGPVSSELAWFDQAGRRTAALGGRADYGDVELASDGKRATITVGDSALKTLDLWVVDLARDLRTRLTFNPGEDNTAIWSPDGTRIVYASAHNGTLELYERNTNGVGPEEPLLVDHRNKFPACWSPDGRYILYMVDDGDPTGWDLWVLPLFGDRKAFPFLQTPFNEAQGRFSSDGKWIAYISNESGLYEVYVTPFPGPGGRWQISSIGSPEPGVWPRWRRDGKEIFYFAADGTLMAAAITMEGTHLGTSGVRPLFNARWKVNRRWPYDVSPDGQRFLMNTVVERGASAPLTVTLNWTEALKP
jgi:Tol biopolymer transport system component